MTDQIEKLKQLIELGLHKTVVFDRVLYVLAKGDGTLEDVTVLMRKYGSPYRSRASWGQFENEITNINTLARNALRKWANHTYSLAIPMLAPSLSEMERYQVPVEYRLGKNEQPAKVVVLGEKSVSGITAQNSKPKRKRVKRYGFTIKSPRIAKLFKQMRAELDLTVDEFIGYLLNSAKYLNSVTEPDPTHLLQ